METDRKVLRVITSAMALVRAEDALDAEWTPERVAVVEDRNAAFVREVRNLTGSKVRNGRLIVTTLVMVRNVLRDADDAILRSACDDLAELID
jgi:hypothetical protein